MEQATNQFNKGLQMDTNPMVQGNDTLTDCLNGTLITMNGNEVILQNDMGNRRVSNAFLPPGYEPVGMKEYGGIIYVAAYNPITNKSQIGSFPSPQRKIDSLNGESNPLKGVNFDDTFFNPNYNNISPDPNLNGISVLRSDSFLYPLTKNLQIHSGDKFVVYAPGLSQLRGLLSNYNNIKEGKIYSPKNKKYTLQLGVLNSQNEFVDITKTLERWGADGEIIPNNSEYAEDYRFNQGYFIPDGFTDELQGETIDDASLLLERQKLSTNTYSYKLVGPLYLKVIYNHIQNFNYNIDANVSEIKTKPGGTKYKELELTIEGYLTYNCPDVITSPESESINDSKYYTYEEVSSPDQNFGFHLLGQVGDTMINYEKNYISFEQSSSPSKYDPNSNTYSVKITKIYKIEVGENQKNFNYILGVLAHIPLEGESPIYLKECSSSGNIDISLIRSNKVFFKEWRFLNNVEQHKTTLLYNFNSYPKKDCHFKNLKFHFEKLVREGETSKSFDYPFDGSSLPLNNGRAIQTIDWGDTIEERSAYKVTVSYDIYNETTEETKNVQLEEEEFEGFSEQGPIKRWFLSTELLNSLYPTSSKILDFCNPGRDKLNEIQNFFKVSYKLNIEKNITPNGTSFKKFGSFFTFNNQYAHYSYQKQDTYSINVNAEIELQNIDLYPEFVSLPSNYSLSLYNITNIKIGEENTINQYVNTALCKVSENIRDVIGFDDSQRSDFKDKELVNIYVSNYSDNIIKLETKCMHYYCGPGSTINQIENAFVDLKKGLAQHLPKPGYYGGVYPGITLLSGNQVDHVLDCYYNQQGYPPTNFSQRLLWNNPTQKGDTVVYRYNNIDNNINSEFDNHCFPSQVIQFIFPQEGVTHQIHQNVNSQFNNEYARVWWKFHQDRGGEPWLPLSNLIKKSDWEEYLRGERDLSFFLEILGISTYYNYVYSPLKYDNNSPLKVAKLNNSIHTTNYSFPISLNLTFNGDATLNTINHGVLNFHADFSTISQEVENIIEVESDSNFTEEIEQYDFDKIKNIYYSEDQNVILTEDDQGRELDPYGEYYTNFNSSTGTYSLHKLTRNFPFHLKDTGNIRMPLGNPGKIPYTQVGDEDSYSSQQNGTTKLIFNE